MPGQRSAWTAFLALVLGLGPLSCGAPAGQPSHDAAAKAEQPDRVAEQCAHYQSLATSPPSFSVVQQIFDDFCVSCHTAGADLDLSDGRAWMDLVNHAAPATEACGQILVVPGDAMSSYLYQKLTNPHPCSGAQMPIDEFFRSTPLPACMTGLIGDWVSAGAPSPAMDGSAIPGG